MFTILVNLDEISTSSRYRLTLSSNNWHDTAQSSLNPAERTVLTKIARREAPF